MDRKTGNTMIKKGYTYRYGVVKQVVHGRAVIELQKIMKKNACKGCSLCATDIPTISLRLSLDDKEFHTGDQVAVGTQEMNEAEAALIAFGLPILGALSTYFFLTLVLGWGGEKGITVGVTLLMGALSFGGVVLVDHLLRFIYPIDVLHIQDLAGRSIEDLPSCNL